MAEEWPMIPTWCGVPLNEMPREDLEQALIDTCKQLQEAHARECECSIAHVRDLAEMARRR